MGLKVSQKVYTENSEDIYGDGSAKVDHVKSVKRFDLKRMCPCYKDMKIKKKKEEKICLTDPTLHRECEGKQAIFFLAK